jgi:endonuclease/exonuclease/phosphatase family metal-dependent hydrolase
MFMKALFASLALVASFSVFAGETYKVSAYNLGLAHGFVAYAKERIDPLIGEMLKVNADVYCLSEVWTNEDRTRIIRGLGKDYPHAHFTPITQTYSTSRPTCRVSDLFGKDKFATCVLKSCRGLDDSEFTQCVTSTCGPALRALQGDKRHCAQALMAQVGNSTARSLMRVLSPLRRAGLFAYNGGNGLLLMSRDPIANPSTIDLTDISTLNRRGVLKGEVRGKQLYCAHLTANLDGIAPYTGPFESWEEENYAQIERVLEDTVEETLPVMMMGDFNCSPNLPGTEIKEDFVAACDLFETYGFDNFYYQQNPQCTFCDENSIIAANPSESGGYLLDHIFTRDLEFGVIERVFDEVREIPVGRTRVRTHLSDHFGLIFHISK